MDQPYLRQFEKLCIQEEPPACQTTCPIQLEARSFLDLMAAGKVREARKCLERTMPLASLTALVCDGDCLAHCVRQRVDSFVNIPLVERACVLHSSPVKPFPLPPTGRKIAVVGSSLSGLSAASELAKKGHGVTVFYRETPGCSLIGEFSAQLAKGTLNQALEEIMGQLKSLRVEFYELQEDVSEQFVSGAIAKFQALFLGLDDYRVFIPDSSMIQAFAPLSDVTQLSPVAGVCSGGYGAGSGSVIQRVASGKRAAGSIDRFLQGVDPATARENERVRPTLLYTNTNGVPPRASVLPSDAANPTMEEAQTEANRCIRCSCLECVKQCPYLAAYKTYPKKLAREIYNNLSVIQGLRQTNRPINACAECGLCGAVCPNSFDMGVFCATARREMVTENRMPPSAHEFALLDMEQSNADDVAFIRHQPGHAASACLFFPGCQLPASLPRETMMIYTHLCQHTEGGVGLFFHCCGAPARWSGREKLTSQTAQTLEKHWNLAGKPEVIVACASCFEFFAAELPQISCRSLWEVLDETPLPLSPTSSVPLLALHDPCAARERGDTQKAVRSILSKLGIRFEELPLHGALTRCCGYGGLAAASDPALAEEYARARIADSSLPMLAYCAMCRERLLAEGKHTLHLLELLCSSHGLESAMQRKPLGISERQHGRVEFRDQALTQLWHEKTPDRHTQGFDIRYAEGVRELMEKRRIREADVEIVLQHARESGPLFKDGKTSRFLTSLRPRQVTFWVEYRQVAPDIYEICDAYCHRMVVPGVPGEGGATPCTLEGSSARGGRV